MSTSGPPQVGLDSVSFLSAQSSVLQTLQALNSSLSSSSSSSHTSSLLSRLSAASLESVAASEAAASAAAVEARVEVERDVVKPLRLECDALRMQVKELGAVADSDRRAREEHEKKLRKQLKDSELRREQDIFMLKKQGYK